MSSEAQQTPLLDLLRAVPTDARAEYEHGQFHHSMIPYGRLCADAAQAIAERDAEITRLKASERSAWNAAVERDVEIERLKEESARWFRYCAGLLEFVDPSVLVGDVQKAANEIAAERQRARLPKELVERIRDRLDDIAIIDRGTTHWDGCEQDHPRCREAALLRDLLAAVEQKPEGEE